MTVLNFPASPAINDTYTENNVTYTWNGSYWDANNTTSLDDIYVEVSGDVMSGNLLLPGGGGSTAALQKQEIDTLIEANSLWEKDTGTLTPKVDTDNIETAGDIQSTSQNGSQFAGFRNQLINGDFRVWQRGTAIPHGVASYTADRWYRPESGNCSISSSAPTGFSSSFAITGGATGHLYQAIELSRQGAAGQFAVGTTWTLSFYVKSNTPQTVYASTGFADVVNGNNGAADYNGAADTFTTSTAWQRVTRTFTVAATPAGSNACYRVLLRCDSRTSDLYYAGVQLEPSPVPTPFEHRPIQVEFAICQRYYQTLSSFVYVNICASASVRKEGGGMCIRSVEMRTTPTETYATASNITGVAMVGTAQRWYVGGLYTDVALTAQLIGLTADAEL